MTLIPWDQMAAQGGFLAWRTDRLPCRVEGCSKLDGHGGPHNGPSHPLSGTTRPTQDGPFLKPETEREKRRPAMGDGSRWKFG